MASIVLVGAGHAHMDVVRHARALIERGARVHLVEPGSFWYSGMATGMLAGMYEPEEDRIDPGVPREAPRRARPLG